VYYFISDHKAEAHLHNSCWFISYH